MNDSLSFSQESLNLFLAGEVTRLDIQMYQDNFELPKISFSSAQNVRQVTLKLSKQVILVALGSAAAATYFFRQKQKLSTLINCWHKFVGETFAQNKCQLRYF